MKDPQITAPTLRPAPKVMLEEVTTIIDDAVVLNQLSLEIPAGEITVLMGPSGVGKSTMMKHIVGLLPPEEGTILIGDKDIWASSPKQWEEVLSGLGAMLGGSFLITSSTFTSLSVYDNLIYTLEALHVPLEQRHDRAMERIREMDLEQYLDHRPQELPAHATKRLALARALVTDAPLIVLDEIDVGLDSAHSPMIAEAVRNARKRTGCTMLITTHTLEVARTLADHLAIMVNGRIVAFGPPGELLSGIDSSDDFDRTFEFSDMGGPPRREDTSAVAERMREPGKKSSEWPMDPRMVWVVLGIMLVIAILFVVLRVKPF